MDKNTITGFVLMFAILFGFSYFNRPSKEQIEARKHYQDSIRQAEDSILQAELSAKLFNDSIAALSEDDSLKQIKSSEKYGEFRAGGVNAKRNVVLENDLVKINFSTLGAQAESVVLKKFENKENKELTLFNGEEAKFNLELHTASNRILHTADMNFAVASSSDTSVVFSLTSSHGGSLDFRYVLPKDSYMLQFSVVANGLAGSLDGSMNKLIASWVMDIPQQEKGREFENRYAQLYFYTPEDGRDYLSENGNDEKSVEDPVRWVAFKDQYFSSILIADGNLMENTMLKSSQLSDSLHLKKYMMQTEVPFSSGKANFRFFYGPNSYKLLKSFNKGTSGDEKLNLHRLLTLGFSLIRWVNQFFIIPLFDFLGSIVGNYGLVILLLTIVVKLFLTPFTYKSYLSSAKMRVLKPEIDELNTKYADLSPMERSQMVRDFYKDAGVNPAGGCLPMLLSMPFLMAVYFFIPLAIELRHVPFLWADDLSSYDAIISWGYDLPFIGDHLSLFCVLFTVVNVIYTKFNMQMNAGSSMAGGEAMEQQMKMMKYMMYLMPIMFFFWFNKIASGLTYYYFISLLLSIIQTLVIRKSINEKKLLADIEEHRKARLTEKQSREKAERANKQTGSEVISAIDSTMAEVEDNSFMGRLRKKAMDFQNQMAEAQKQAEEMRKNQNGGNDKK